MIHRRLTGIILGLVVLLTTPTWGSAHYFFTVPKSTGEVALLLANTPVVDPSVSMTQALDKMVLNQGKLVAGHPGELQVQGVDRAKVILGRYEAGVVVRGGEPCRVVQQVRIEARGALVAEESPLPGVQIRAVPTEGGLAFLVTREGKPVEATVFVHRTAQSRSELATTSAAGQTKTYPLPKVGEPMFARVMLKETKAGEFEGRAYKEVCHHATVTVGE